MAALHDLRLLRSFVRIVESGSISAAARGLNLPQPTVSRQLRQHGHPKNPSALRALPWMGFLQPHFFIRDRIPLRRGREQRVVHLAPVLLMDGVTALREAAIAGAGITVRPEWLIGESIASGALERVLPDWSIPPIDVHVVFPSGKLPSRLRTFIDFAVEELPRGIQRLSALGRAGR